MNLAMRGQLNPWLVERIQWIEDMVDYYGGSAIYLSGFRTWREQADLYSKRWRSSRPVARPGCSQHQFGMAVDVAFGARFPDAVDIGTFERFARDLAVHVDLVTVSNDPGHFQVWPAWEFIQMARQAGFCPSANTRNPRLEDPTE